MENTLPTVCGCTILRNKITYCTLHETVARRLKTCEYAREFIANLKLSEQDNVAREILFAHLNNVIAAATCPR
jgi:hypothetical protein